MHLQENLGSSLNVWLAGKRNITHINQSSSIPTMKEIKEKGMALWFSLQTSSLSLMSRYAVLLKGYPPQQKVKHSKVDYTHQSSCLAMFSGILFKGTWPGPSFITCTRASIRAHARLLACLPACLRNCVTLERLFVHASRRECE